MRRHEGKMRMGDLQIVRGRSESAPTVVYTPLSVALAEWVFSLIPNMVRSRLNPVENIDEIVIMTYKCWRE